VEIWYRAEGLGLGLGLDTVWYVSRKMSKRKRREDWCQLLWCVTNVSVKKRTKLGLGLGLYRVRSFVRSYLNRNKKKTQRNRT